MPIAPAYGTAAAPHARSRAGASASTSGNVTTAAALDLIEEAIKAAGYKPGADVALALDVAASSFVSDGKYKFEGGLKSSAEMIEYYEQLVADYPLVSIEDPLDEEDWDGWQAFTARFGTAPSRLHARL